jgi:hypothetical protein
MPTYFATARFWAQWARLTPTQQLAFQQARRLFVDGLREGKLNPRLRVKRYRGRSLFSYGDELMPGHPHVIWEAIGTHSIF